MGRYIDAAIFFCTGKAKHVIVFVDGAAHCAQGIVTVGQDIGHGKFSQSRRPGGLDNPHESDVMAGQLIKSDFQLFLAARGIVALQNTAGNGVLSGLLLGDLPAGTGLDGSQGLAAVRNDLGSPQQIGSSVK